MPLRRVPWRFVVGALLLVAIALFLKSNWIVFHSALRLLKHAAPTWLALALIAIVAAFLSAGQIYGRVLATLGYRASRAWLSATALVAILISQAVPAGSLGSYAFLTVSLRRRGIAGTSVALLASLELLSWVGAMLLLFTYGLIYIMITASSGATHAYYPSAASAMIVLGSGLFVGSRPHATLHDWALRLKRMFDRVFGPIWPDSLVLRVVDELDANRRVIMERPGRVLLLICLQLTIFVLHSFALLAILWSLGATIGVPAMLAAYGLALIASTFTLLPGGGGTVEAALALVLNAQGVPLEAAIAAAILFRLFSFWLLLPVGALCYRRLTRP